MKTQAQTTTNALSAIEASRVHDANWRAAWQNDPHRPSNFAQDARRFAWLVLACTAGLAAVCGAVWAVDALVEVLR